jgi:hypothetical protein
LVNVLIGASQRATRQPRENELLLNGADGLDWETLVKCDLMYRCIWWRRSGLYRCQGRVGTARRRAFVQRIKACFGFTLV